MLHEVSNTPTTAVLVTPRASQPRSAQPDGAMTAVTDDRARAVKRKLDLSGDESDGSTATNVCIGDRVYTVTITNELIRNRQVEASQVAKKAIVKKVDEDFFVTFDNRELPVTNNGKQLSRVIIQAYKDQGNLDQKPAARTRRFQNIDPSRIIIVKTEGSDSDGSSSSSSSEPIRDREVDYGVWFTKVGDSEKYQKILKKIKNRPALNEVDGGRATKKYNEYFISDRTDACHLLVAIQGVASKNYRNWKRESTKAVMYEMVYRYMETHQVVLNREGIKALINDVKKKSPSFEESDKLFSKQDGFLIQVKK